MSSTLRSLIVLHLAGVLAVSGCGDDSSTGPDTPDDTMSIRLVTPESGLVADVATNFAVTVDFELASADSGELQVGFNSVRVDQYHMISAAKVLVASGSGEHQFNVSVIPKDWGDAGDFAVHAIISEYPHEWTWTPLARDTRVLTFDQ